MVQMCPAKSIIVPFKKQMYSSGSIILSYKNDKCICVSIHAPTRGATVCGFSFLLEFLRFNPRTHEGCDEFPSLLRFDSFCFNPRTHEGCDSFSYALLLKFISFNPRTHEGCDY